MTRTHATWLSLLLVALFVAGPVRTAAVMQGWPGTGGDVAKSTSYIDYVPIWTAGRLAREGRPADAYDWTAHGAETARLLGRERKDYQPWGYPPMFLAVTEAFAALPYGASMALWVTFSVALFSLAGALIVGDWRGAIWVAAASTTLINMMLGQTGLLSASLFGLGLLALPSRPAVAGVLLGLLAYKPHVGVLIPLALAAAGCWRAFAAAAVTVCVLAIASLGSYGLETWAAFFDAVPRQAELVLNRHPEWLQSVFGFLTTVGAPNVVAFSIHGLVALGAAVLVVTVWRQRDAALEVRSAILIAASLLVSPYLFNYDLALLVAAQAFLVRHALASNAVDAPLLGVMVGSSVLVFACRAAGLPLGLIATFATLALALSRLPDPASLWRDVLPGGKTPQTA